MDLLGLHLQRQRVITKGKDDVIKRWARNPQTAEPNISKIQVSKVRRIISLKAEKRFGLTFPLSIFLIKRK